MSRSFIATLGALFVTSAFAPATHSADPWHQSFNKFGTIPYHNGSAITDEFPLSSSVLGGVTTGVGPVVDGRAELPEVNRITLFGGAVTTWGSADFDNLKAYVKIDGDVSDHQSTATTHQILNVSDPAVAPGTTGTLHLRHSLSGVADFGGSDQAVNLSLRITHNILDSGIGGNVLTLEERTLQGSTAAVGAGSIFTAVPFVYGEDFRLTTTFRVQTVSDRAFDFIGGTTYQVNPESQYEFIEAAFDQSATLDAIFLPDNASISLVGATPLYFGDIVRFGVPVPLPLPILMFAQGLVVLLLWSVRSKSRRDAFALA